LGCERAHLILGFISNRGNYCDTSHIQECHCAVFRSERGSLNRKKKKTKNKNLSKALNRVKEEVRNSIYHWHVCHCIVLVWLLRKWEKGKLNPAASKTLQK
jgi:hypothetical protein